MIDEIARLDAQEMIRFYLHAEIPELIDGIEIQIAVIDQKAGLRRTAAEKGVEERGVGDAGNILHVTFNVSCMI